MKHINNILFLILLCSLLYSCKSSNKAVRNDNYDKITDEIYDSNNQSSRNKKLYKEIDNWLGVPYKYGGHDKKGTDCSGFVMEIYKSVYNKPIERNSAAIMEKNCKEIKKKDLREGDLVFFATGKNKSRISHVGIYLNESKFAHASSSRGVIISSLNEKYYIRTYKCSGRVIF